MMTLSKSFAKIINGDFALFPGSDLWIREWLGERRPLFLQPCVNRSGGKPDRRLEKQECTMQSIVGLRRQVLPFPRGRDTSPIHQKGQSEPNRDGISMSSSLPRYRFHKLRASACYASEPYPSPAIAESFFYGDSHTSVVGCRAVRGLPKVLSLKPSGPSQMKFPFVSVRSKVTRSQRSIFAMRVTSSWNPSGREPITDRQRFTLAGAGKEMLRMAFFRFIDWFVIVVKRQLGGDEKD